MTEKGIHDSSRLKKYGIAWHTPKQHENQCGSLFFSRCRLKNFWVIHGKFEHYQSKVMGALFIAYHGDPPPWKVDVEKGKILIQSKWLFCLEANSHLSGN